MATKYTQDNRSILVTTPLGKDVLLLEGFTGSESVSGLFSYRLDLLAEDPAKVKFDQLLGKMATVTVVLPDGKKRYISGLVSQLTEGNKVASAKQDSTFVRYRAELVPEFWILKRKIRSQIFQELSVPDILKKMFAGLKVSYRLQGTYEPRNMCVQYREADFDFTSRLMEEEGIYYYFTHTSSAHEMVVADSPQGHSDMPEFTKATFEEAGDHRVYKWEKNQQIRSGKYVLTDHHFELPDKDLGVDVPTLDSLAIGTVTHKLKVADNTKLDITDYPGGYARRFDGVALGGGDQASKLQKIFEDNKRTVEIRMQQETVQAVDIVGESDCRNFTTGHKFTLERHFNSDGSYVLTRLEQRAALRGAYTTGGKVSLNYANTFHCIPVALPFRPQQKTPKPLIRGAQTAVVVGPAGTEIFTDKYGRIQVQFFWDPDKKHACWVRVGSLWAGKQWGAVHIPRVGQEVIVAFYEGDPDQPVIVGSVYNADQMPPYALPDNMTQSGLKSRSTTEGTAETFNELRLEDKKGEEEIYFHAEKDFNRVVENNDTLKVGSDQADDGSQTIEIWKNRTTTIKEGDETFTLEKGSRIETIKEGDETVTIEKGNRTISVKTDDTETVEGKQTVTITGDRTLEVKTGNYSTKASAGTVTVEAATTLELKVGGNSIKIDSSGITIEGSQIKLTGAVTVSGATCKISSGSVTIG